MNGERGLGGVSSICASDFRDKSTSAPNGEPDTHKSYRGIRIAVRVYFHNPYNNS